MQGLFVPTAINKFFLDGTLCKAVDLWDINAKARQKYVLKSKNFIIKAFFIFICTCWLKKIRCGDFEMRKYFYW